MPERTRRLFFALWPDEAPRVALVHATRKAVQDSGGRPVAEHNLHATLLFLGSVAESRVSEVARIGAQAARETLLAHDSSPELVFDRIELFQKAHVLVATTSVSSGSGHLVANALVGSLQRETTRAGFTPDLKHFRAHVTLARKAARPARAHSIRPVIWSLSDFALVASRTESSGSVYTVLETFPVGTPAGLPRVM
jgi:RNA 2',3'-cyclic 3'-phosphodiesterase